MIEDSIIKRIIDCWAADQTHPHRVQRPLPNHAEVKNVVVVSFLASLKREEDRPIRFSIVLASPDELTGQPHRYRYEIQYLAAPLPFTVESISKLAPALDPSRSAIAVGKTDGGGELTCWGIFFYDPRSHRYNEIPVGTEGGTSFRPDLFSVTAKVPGALQISRMDSHIGRFVNGEFIPASPSPLTSTSLGSHLIQSLEQTALWQKYNTFYWHYYCDALEVLLFEAASRGHGATIVILENTNANYHCDFIVERYRFTDSVSLNDRFENAMTHSRDIISGIAYRKRILEHLQVLAQLSTVDGALVLSTELDLISFGATLKAPKWDGKVILGPDGYGYTQGAPFNAKRLGTRHNSAIDFVAACPGSIVFVISQDGPIRGFVRSEEDAVLCWPDCTESMFV